MADVRELIRRLAKGESLRQVAADLDLSRNTVARYRAWAIRQGLLRGAVPDPAALDGLLRAARERSRGPQEQSKVEPHRERVEALRRQGVEAQAIWRLLVDERGFTGSYSSVKRFVRRLGRQAPPRACIRIEVEAGEEAQVDFGYGGKVFDPRSGTERRAWVFVMTLSFSRHQYAELVFDQSIVTWCRLHAAAFEFFGGVPGRLVLDNLKAAIVRASLYDPEIQRTYRELCEHYDVLASPCRPKTPEHKGKVEQGGVHYVKRNALAGRSFRDLQAANQHLRHWCLEIAGRRTHGTTRLVPWDVFEQVERGALKPLPATRWEFCEWKVCKLHPDCHVVFDKAYYSAPHRLIGRRLLVRGGAALVQIFCDHELVASHPRAARAGERRTLEAHLPPEKLVYLLQGPVWCRRRAHEIGAATGAFIERLLGDKPLDRLRGAQGVLRLSHKYGPQRLEAACARALAFDEVRYLAVKKILLDGLDLQPLPLMDAAPPPPAAPPKHARPWSDFFPEFTPERRSEWN